VNFVKGFEHAKEASYPLQASACCKHFVANGEAEQCSSSSSSSSSASLSFPAPLPSLLSLPAPCHLFFSELDHSNGTDRYHFDAIVPQQDRVDSYLPSFQACVEEGQVSGIMCSYNSVNGVLVWGGGRGERRAHALQSLSPPLSPSPLFLFLLCHTTGLPAPMSGC
jgi:hypothetical protein